jgi:hypothetical protein
MWYVRFRTYFHKLVFELFCVFISTTKHIFHQRHFTSRENTIFIMFANIQKLINHDTTDSRNAVVRVI